MPTTVTMSGPGTTTIVDDAATAIINQTLAQQALLNSIILQIGSPEVPETMLAVMSGTQGTLSIMSSKMSEIDKRLQELNVQLNTLNGKMEQSRTGLAAISTHMSQQSTVQKMMFLDQVKHNEFQQQTTNQSLKDAGKPPTVVTPTAFVAKVEATLKDITTINAQTSIVSTITDYSTQTLTTAYEESLAWAAKTAIGTWIVETWASAKLKVTALFSAEQAKKIVDDGKQALLDVKAGNSGTIIT